MNIQKTFKKPLLHFIHRYFQEDQEKETLSVISGSVRAYGIDISHWESSFDPMKAEQGLIDFAIFKATEGSTWVDTHFERFYQASGPIPIVGAYHYLRSQYSVDSQVGNFLNAILGKSLNIVVCDFESTFNDMTDAFVKKANDWGFAIKAALPNVKLLFYTNPSIYDNVVYPASVRIYGKDVFKSPPWDGLWIAQYYFFPSPDKNPSMPITRSDWVIWQYSETGEPELHGTGGWCDQNVFNGTVEQMYSWLGQTPPPPTNGEPNGGEQMNTILFSNGVTQTQGRLFDSDFEAWVIPSNAILKPEYLYFKDGVTAEEVDADFVYNITPFDYEGNTLVPNMGVIHQGRILFSYRPTNPFLAWGSNNVAIIHHSDKIFDDYTEVSQFFRYVIEKGIKNPLWDAKPERIKEWNEKHPRTFVGKLPNGSTVIVFVKGRQSGQAGWSLNEAANYALDLGCDYFGDADGGKSVQGFALINNQKTLFTGVPPAERGKVAVVGAIRLKSPLTIDTEPPPPPDSGEKMLQYENGVLIRTWVVEN